MKIRPLHDRVLVRRAKEEEKSSGGIILTDSAKEKPMQGEVISVGKGKILNDGTIRTLDVKEKDKIVFGKYSGNEIKIDGEELLIMKEEDIMGIMED